KLSVPDLRKHYPELRDLDLVNPDILDDAETLETIGDSTNDFLIAAHLIEHARNPLRALENWCRVVQPEGVIYLVAPDKRVTVDKLRNRTTLEHIILDYVTPSEDRDYEHFLDYATLVHNKRGYEALDEARRLHDEKYSIHFHVFVPEDMQRLLEWFEQNVRKIEIVEGPAQAAGSDEFHFLIRVQS